LPVRRGKKPGVNRDGVDAKRYQFLQPDAPK